MEMLLSDSAAQVLTLFADASEEATQASGESILGGFTSYLLFALGMILMLSVVLRRMTHVLKRSRRRSPKKQVKEVRAEMDATQARTDSRLIDAPSRYGRWNAEVNDIVREAYAQIDTKIAVLQSTIRLADETRLRLERTMEQASQMAKSLELEPSTDSSEIEPISQDVLASLASLYEEDQNQLESLLAQLNRTTNEVRDMNHTESTRRNGLPKSVEMSDVKETTEPLENSASEDDPLFGEESRQLRVDQGSDSEQSLHSLTAEQEHHARSLLKQGKSLHSIASTLGIAVGELELWQSME